MSQSDEQQIRSLIETWLAATREGDLDTVLSLMTEDVLFLTPGNAPMSREDFAAGSRSMAGKVEIDGRSEVQEITVAGDKAICWTRLEIVVTPEAGGPPAKRAGTTLSVFHKGEDGCWRLWRDANMLGATS